VAADAVALAARFAPVYLQHVSPEHPERDRPVPIDFDGDWDSTNNWAHLDERVHSLSPAVYASAILSETHAFLTYTLFYPRDWTSLPCVPYACHDNDLEVVLLVVERDGPGGTLVLVETKTHSHFLALEGERVARDAEGRPVLEVETEGHGIYAVERNGKSGVRGSFAGVSGNDLVALVPENALRGMPSTRYDLLPLRELWDRRRNDARVELWSNDLEWYSGERIGTRGHAFGTSLEWKVYGGGVRPPWGLAADGPRGDWFLDPAFVARTRHPERFQTGKPLSLAYAYNPYLDDLTSECSGARCSRPLRAELPGASTETGSLSALGLVLLAVGKRARAGARRAAGQRPAR
jgi:hypothetical protein